MEKDTEFRVLLKRRYFCTECVSGPESLHGGIRQERPCCCVQISPDASGGGRNVLTEAGNIFLIIRLCLLWTGPDDDLFNQGTVFNGRFRPVT